MRVAMGQVPPDSLLARSVPRVRPFEAKGVSRLFLENHDFADVSSTALIGELARALA